MIGASEDCFDAVEAYGNINVLIWMSVHSCQTEEKPEPETISVNCKSEIFGYLGCGK